MRDNGTAPPWSPVAGELVAERFDLEREIARGSMGAIWRAHHVRLDCPVAIKFIDAKYADSDFLRDRFQREARAAARLRGRHVVQILDYGVYEQLPYIAMELLEGENLGERLDREGRLGVAETLRWVKGAVLALAKASTLDIVHRDLKPENLFIVKDEGEEYIKVLDFGVAKLRDASLFDSKGATKPGVLVGTPYYMSPEQVDGDEVDPRADLWSLAVIVYECLTGEAPFDGEAIGTIVRAISAGKASAPSEHAPELPPAFDAWWARATERDPAARYPNPVAFYEALYDALVDPDTSQDVPRRSLMFSLAPDDRVSGGPPASDRSSDNLSWSGPHSSARPEASPAPPESRRTPLMPSLGEASSDEPTLESSDRPSTFTGHSSTAPGPLHPDNPTSRWLLPTAVAALVFGGMALWSKVEPAPQSLRAGAMTRPIVLQLLPTATPVPPQEPKAEASRDEVPSVPAKPTKGRKARPAPRPVAPLPSAVPEARPATPPQPPTEAPPPEAKAPPAPKPDLPDGI